MFSDSESGLFGFVEAGMLVLEVGPAQAFAAVHLVHLAEGGFHAVDGREDVEGVSGFGDGVHVADGKTDGGGGAIDPGEGGGHGIGAGVAAGKVDLVGDAGFADRFLNQGIDEGAGDGAIGEGEALAHGEAVHALGGEAGGGVVIVVDVGSDEDVGPHFPCDGRGSKAADFLVGGDGVKDADIFEGLFGKQAGEFGDHETAEAVIEVGTVEGVFGEALADGSIEDDGIAGTDAEFFDALLAVFSVHLELEEKHLGFDALVAGALGGLGEVNGSHGLDGAAFDDPVLARFVGVLGEELHLMADEGAGEEGVAVDPNFSVLADAADLQAYLIGMADEHDRGALVLPGMGVEDDAGVALKLPNGPRLGFDLLEHWFEDAVTHRSFKPNGAGSGEDLAHEVELFGGHRLGPSLLFFGGGLFLRSHLRSDRA